MSDQDKLQQANDLLDDVRSREDSPALAEASADVWQEREAAAPPSDTPEAPPSDYPDPTSYMTGFTAATHWDGNPGAVDWYAAPRGTWCGWPVAGTAYAETLMGPQGPIHTCVFRAEDGYVDTFTHALDTLKLGYHPAGEPFFQVGDSGIETLPGNPSHIHYAVSQREIPANGPDGPQGNVPALERLQGLGFDIQLVSRIPGPQDYAAGRANAGRFV